MNAARKAVTTTVAAFAVVSLLGWTGFALGQTFSSGSTGADGALNPAVSTVIALPPDGVLNYTSVTIPAGVIVTFQPNAANTPVTMLATGDVTINGEINLNGANGQNEVAGGSTLRIGALGGPGGFRGGNGTLTGGPSLTSGQGPGGGDQQGNGNYGAPAAFVSLIPLFGGSGGGGGVVFGGPGAGSSGGGGGGAIVIASSSKIVLPGVIRANGGLGGTGGFAAGCGSGGAIRLVAPLITGTGALRALCNSGVEVVGKIRLEAFTVSYTGSYIPALGTHTTISLSPGPVTPASNPALVALPTLRIASVGGVAAPANPGGSYGLADVLLAQGTVNPVPVAVAATNLPTSAAVRVKLFPQSGPATTSGVLTPAGTFLSSTTTGNVTFPLGTVSVVQAWATMTLTGQIASLFPSIDGEAVESVAMASPLEGGKPVLNLVTKSGREKRFDELAPADQSKVIVAWQALAANR